MTRASSKEGGKGPARPPLGAALRQAWVGYQQLLEEQMTASGVRRRHFPDGRVMHICARSPDTTISDIGRELGITRQGASKIVGVLREQGFVEVRVSPTDGREKLVTLTGAATAYLDAQRRAAGAIERRLKAELGEAAFEAIYDLVERVGSNESSRLRGFLRTRSRAIHLE